MNPMNDERYQPGIFTLNSGMEGYPPIFTGYNIIGHGENNLWTSYSGMDNNCIPLHVTQWKIDLAVECDRSMYQEEFNIITNQIYSYAHKLINLPEKENLVRLKYVNCSLDESILTVTLARDAVNGLSIKALSQITNWNVHRIRQIVVALLECLAFLHKEDLTHGNISDTTAIVDENGTWKVADYTINGYLNHLASNKNEPYIFPNAKTDLLAIADLIASLGVSGFQVNDFINKCKSDLTETISELTEHPLLLSLHKSFDDFVILGKLGAGGFGQVLRVKDIRIDQNYAIKRIKGTRMADLNKANKEAKTIEKLRHKHVVRYYRSWTEKMNESQFKEYNDCNSLSEENDETDENAHQQIEMRKRDKTILVMYIQMELCEHDLRKLLDVDVFKNDMSRAKRFIFGIAEGLKFIHSKGTIHRDLKPENIFIKNDTIKIGDFGLSTSRKSLSRAYCGTKKYMAPEIGKRGVQARADMYSFGIILFEMCYSMKNRHIRDRILDKIRQADAPIEPYIERSHEFFEVIKNLLNHDVKKRYTAANLLMKYPNYKLNLQSISNGNTLTFK